MNPDDTKLRVRFTRKPCCLADVRTSFAPDDASSPVAIELLKDMTAIEYDAFAENLLLDQAWLTGRGGYINRQVRSVVMVTAPERVTLYIDPSGSGYARYVGVAA